MKTSLELAKELYVDVNTLEAESKELQQKLPQLPASCYVSGERLLASWEIFEHQGVFPPVVIARMLNSYDDKDLSQFHNGKSIDELRQEQPASD